MKIIARGVGRRKEAVAQVQIVKTTKGTPGGQFIINNIPAEQYLHNNTCSILSMKAPLSILRSVNTISEEKNTNNESLTNEINDGSKSIVNNLDNFNTIVKVKGGGLVGQAEAIKLGLARAICQLYSITSVNEMPSQKKGTGNTESILNDNNTIEKSNSIKGDNGLKSMDSLPQFSTAEQVYKEYKDKGYLTQDSRIKERRKYGLKKARKASQYHKR